MKESLDRFFLFIFKISFFAFTGILVLRALNAVSFRISNSYLVSWKWLNSLFVGTDPIGGVIILLALLSGISYLVWLWWDPFLVRLPHQKGSGWVYYDWEEGLEPAPEWEYILELRAIILDYPIYNPKMGPKMAIAAFKKLKKIAPQEAKNLLDYISKNLAGHLQNYPQNVLQDLKKI